MKKVIFAVLAILIAGGATGAYWYGNQPKVTYYPSGNIKTSVEQKFFKEDGEYKAFNEDGTLAQKYTVADGIKTGPGFIYAGAVTAEVNFVNGSLSGPIKLDTKDKAPEIDNLKISVAGGELTVKMSIPEQKNTGDAENPEMTASEYVLGGRITCEEGEFLNGMQAFLSEQNLDTFKNFAGCVSLTSGKIDDELYGCEYKGGYQYPRFTTETIFECKLKDTGEQMLAMMLEDSEAKGLGKLGVSLSYSPSERKFFFQASDDKGLYHYVKSFKGMEESISALTEFAFSKQENKDIFKLASDILNNLTITDSQLEVEGKVVSAINGEFNFIKGFSNPWTLSNFVADNVLTSQIKITNKGMVANLIYPISQKPFITAGIQIDEVIKDKYKSLIELILKEYSEKSEEEATEDLMNVMPKYAMSFSDVVKSVNFLLMNNQGEKVLGSVMTVKPNADFSEMTEDILKVFDIRIVSYQNNKPYQVIAGDTTNGFAVNDKVIAPDELENYLDIETIEKLVKQAEAEYEQIASNSAQSDPVFGAASGWYYNGLNADEADDADTGTDTDTDTATDEVNLEMITDTDVTAEKQAAEPVAEANEAAEVPVIAGVAEVNEVVQEAPAAAAEAAAEVKDEALQSPEAIAAVAEVKEVVQEAPVKVAEVATEVKEEVLKSPEVIASASEVNEVVQEAPAKAAEAAAEVKEEVLAPVVSAPEVKEAVPALDTEDELLSEAPTE